MGVLQKQDALPALLQFRRPIVRVHPADYIDLDRSALPLIPLLLALNEFGDLEIGKIVDDLDDPGLKTCSGWFGRELPQHDDLGLGEVHP